MFKVNAKLKETVLEVIPKDGSKAVKTYAVYKKLCELLDYGMDAYLDPTKIETEYANSSNLENVDGVSNCNVVCFTFDAIFIQLLREAGICSEEEYSSAANGLIDTKTGQFKTGHAGAVSLTFDGVKVNIDSTYSVLEGGMTAAKIGGELIGSWDAGDLTVSEEESWDNIKKEIEKYEEAQKDPFLENVQSYITAKADEFKNMSLEERVAFFQQMLKFTPPNYSVSGFGYITVLKRALFPNNIIKKGKKTFLDIKYVIDKKNNEYRIIMCYNPEGYTNDLGYENFDDLQIYDISLKNRTFRSLTIEELHEKEQSQEYMVRSAVADGNDKILKTQMAAKGGVLLHPVYEGGQPTIDSQQQATNIIGYKRELHTGELIDWNENVEEM